MEKISCQPLIELLRENAESLNQLLKSFNNGSKRLNTDSIPGWFKEVIEPVFIAVHQHNPTLSRRVFDALRGRGTTIHFAHFPDAAPPPRLLAAAGADVLSLPATLSIDEARAELGADTVLQGNLDNRLLASGPLDAVDAAARECLRQGGGRGHVFNLGHGLLRETPHEHVVHLLSLVRSVRWDR